MRHYGHTIQKRGDRYVAFRDFYDFGRYPNQKKWSEDNNYLKQFHVGEDAPTKEDIIKYQKEIIQNNYGKAAISESIGLQSLENDIFLYQNVPGQDFYSSMISSSVAQDIQEALVGLNSPEIQKIIKDKNIENKIKKVTSELRKNVVAWKKILNSFNNSNVSGHGIKKALAALERNMHVIEGEVKNIALQINNQRLEMIITEYGLENTKSFFRSMGGIAAVLKGFLTEVYGAEYLNNIFSQFTRNEVAIKTGSISVGGKDAKSDILIFDKNIMIPFNGKNVSIADLEKQINKCDKTISVPLDDWNKWVESAKSGVISKNISQNRVSFHKGFPFSDLASKDNLNFIPDIYKESFWNLYHYFQIHEVYHNDIQLSKNQGVRNIANYILSRHLPRLIGEKNHLYLTKEGIQDTGEFILSQLEMHKKMFTINNFGPGKELDVGLNIAKS